VLHMYTMWKKYCLCVGIQIYICLHSLNIQQFITSQLESFANRVVTISVTIGLLIPWLLPSCCSAWRVFSLKKQVSYYLFTCITTFQYTGIDKWPTIQKELQHTCNTSSTYRIFWAIDYIESNNSIFINDNHFKTTVPYIFAEIMATYSQTSGCDHLS